MQATAVDGASGQTNHGRRNLTLHNVPKVGCRTRHGRWGAGIKVADAAE